MSSLTTWDSTWRRMPSKCNTSDWYSIQPQLAIEVGRNFLHKTRFYPAKNSNNSGSWLFRGYVDWMVEFQRPYNQEMGAHQLPLWTGEYKVSHRCQPALGPNLGSFRLVRVIFCGTEMESKVADGNLAWLSCQIIQSRRPGLLGKQSNYENLHLFVSQEVFIFGGVPSFLIPRLQLAKSTNDIFFINEKNCPSTSSSTEPCKLKSLLGKLMFGCFLTFKV